MTIKNFLSTHVEGYLFKDIRSMMRAKLRKGQKVGGIGYPPLTSTLAGMELLGGLLQKSKFESQGHSTEYFNNYWDNFFSVDKPKYKTYRDAFWKLIRNGIAHTYVAKTGIWVIRKKPHDHLTILKDSKTNYYMFVDIEEFFNDFVESYKIRVRPLIYNMSYVGSISKAEVQLRLDEMLNAYARDSNSTLGKIILPIGVSLMTMNNKHMFSGASGLTSGTVLKH